MLYDWSMDSNHSTSVSFLNFLVAYFAKRNLNSGDFEKRAIRNPARIPPQTPPAGGKSAEAGRIHTPSQLFRPAESTLVFRIFRKMGSNFFKQTPRETFMSKNLPTFEFILKNYKNFNARATRDALIAYWKHLEKGGKMFWTVAGAMSSAQLGITLAPAIRQGLIHGISSTGANLEESLFRLVAHSGYKDFPDYRYFTKEDDTRILENGMRRVTDTSIPEDEAFRAVENLIAPMWKNATKEN